jgi:hypothetical protein
MRERHEALVQHREPADAGVEDGNRKLSLGTRHGRVWSQARRAQPPVCTRIGKSKAV